MNKPDNINTCNICTLVPPMAVCLDCEFHVKTVATVLDVRTVEDCGQLYRVADIIELGALLPYSVRLYSLGSMEIARDNQWLDAPVTITSENVAVIRNPALNGGVRWIDIRTPEQKEADEAAQDWQQQVTEMRGN